MKYIGLTALAVLIATPVAADHFIFKKKIADIYKCDKAKRLVKPTADAAWTAMPEGSICAQGPEEVAYYNTTGGPNTATGYQSIMSGGTDTEIEASADVAPANHNTTRSNQTQSTIIAPVGTGQTEGAQTSER